MDMDVGESDKQEKNVKDIPPVPIKTYKWEDVRRAKLRGLYPYTYLTKDKMDESKIKISDSVVEMEKDIQDVEKKQTSNKVKMLEEGHLESVDSSVDDNISQCLDKDDKPTADQEPSTSKTVTDSNGDRVIEEEENRANRAKSEEPKRKRKLSIESAYSRISLPKFGVMKRLRAVKQKLKLPKINISKSEPKLNDNKDDKTKLNKQKQNFEPKRTDDKPIYIHIPLKPPEGQTDEFSYLEFEDPSNIIDKKSTKDEEVKDNVSPDLKSPSQNGITNDVQFIILTAPSDDEVLDDHAVMPDSASSDKKFFDGPKIKELKSLAKGCMDDISTDAQIDGIIFEDVIQVEYVDEHNNPIGTTERSNFLEINEETLPTIEKQLSQRNILEELQKEVTSSMDSINKLARNRSLRSLRSSPNKTRSNEGLKELGMSREAPELSSLPSINVMKKSKSLKENRRAKIDWNEKRRDKKSVDSPKESAKAECANQDNIKSEDMGGKVVNMYVDEEDGLKISEETKKTLNDQQEKENQSKTTESQLGAPNKVDSLKKSVSFKKKSKQEDLHGVYEDVKIGNGKEDKVLESGQSMSVDEEKSYLDETIVKSTSLEEDYNKWSKINDHEYEPINPPATENSTIQPSQDIKPQEIKSSLKKTTSVRIPLHEDVIVHDLPAQEESTEDSPLSDSPIPTTSTVNTSEKSQKNKIQAVFRTQAGKIRTKFKGMKKPQNLEKLKIKKPNININVPKIPDTVKVNLPSFTFPKKTTITKTKTTTTKERQYSTESNVGGSKTKIFNFSTYPRIFKRKNKGKFDDLDVTLPRKKDKSLSKKDSPKKSKDSPKKSKDSPKIIRIPLHSEESMDREDLDLSSYRYNEDIEIEKDYLRETQEMHKEVDKQSGESQKFNEEFNKYNIEFNNDLSRNRWKHGKFYGENLSEIAQGDDVKVTDLDNDMDVPQSVEENISSQLDTNINNQLDNVKQQELNKDVDIQRDLEIPRDFRADYRSISSSGDLHHRGVVEEIDSDEFFLREKGISQDNIQIGAYLSSQIKESFKSSKIPADDSFETDQSIQEIPKRRPMKKPKRKKTPNVSREQISYEHESEGEEKLGLEPVRPKRKPKKRFEEREVVFNYCEDDHLRHTVSDIALRQEDEHHFYDGDFRKDFPQMYENEQMEGIEQPNILLYDPYEQRIKLAKSHQNEFPEAPPRKQKSLKSLVSEHDSIIDEITYANQNKEIEACSGGVEYIIPTPEEPPQRPSRNRSRTRSQSRNQMEGDISQELEEQLKMEEMQEQSEPLQEPCNEEPCTQTICDYMGYAIIDKSKQKDPPLPPPPRKKRSPTDGKFFTCPRPSKGEAPVRPSRNYSTLIPKSKSIERYLEKENIDVGQYIEIDDEEGHSRLQSGDVLKKMKDRPLPAPPRPPRKGKEQSKSPLSDITNLKIDEQNSQKQFEENEVSVQTEPLPDGFICEELVEEKGDKVLTPRERRPIKEFEHQETITHGALLITPVPENFEEGPLTQFSRSTEKIITIKREYDDDQPQAKDPEEHKTHAVEHMVEKPVLLDQISVLKAHKLQVEDLDVNRLTVNELLASKIKVSEIEGDYMKVSEVNPEGGNVIVGGVELSRTFLKGLIDHLEKEREIESFNAHDPFDGKIQHPETTVSKKVKSKIDESEVNLQKEYNQLPQQQYTEEIHSNHEPGEECINNLTRHEAEAIANDILSDILQELSEGHPALHDLSVDGQKKKLRLTLRRDPQEMFIKSAKK